MLSLEDLERSLADIAKHKKVHMFARFHMQVYRFQAGGEERNLKAPLQRR